MEEQTQQTQQSEGKEAKRFNQNLSKLAEILDGKSNIPMKKEKLSNDLAVKVAERVLAKRKEKLEKEISDEMEALLDSMIQYNQDVDKLEKEFKKSVSDKQKGFSEKAESLFRKIGDEKKQEADYVNTLREAINEKGDENIHDTGSAPAK